MNLNKCHNCRPLDKLVGHMVEFMDIKGKAHQGRLEFATRPSYYGRYVLHETECDYWFYKSTIDLKTLREVK